MSSGRNFQKSWRFSTRQASARIQALPHTLRPWEISSSLWSLHRIWTPSLVSGLQSHAHSFHVILMLLLFSCQVLSDSSWPDGLQHARLPCPSPSPGICPSSCPSVMPSNHLILYHPLLLLPSVFASIRVFSNESAVCIRWPKYWSFSFSISPSKEYSGQFPLRLTGLSSLLSKELSLYDVCPINSGLKLWIAVSWSVYESLSPTNFSSWWAEMGFYTVLQCLSDVWHMVDTQWMLDEWINSNGDFWEIENRWHEKWSTSPLRFLRLPMWLGTDWSKQTSRRVPTFFMVTCPHCRCTTAAPSRRPTVNPCGVVMTWHQDPSSEGSTRLPLASHDTYISPSSHFLFIPLWVPYFQCSGFYIFKARPQPQLIALLLKTIIYARHDGKLSTEVSFKIHCLGLLE